MDTHTLTHTHKYSSYLCYTSLYLSFSLPPFSSPFFPYFLYLYLSLSFLTFFIFFSYLFPFLLISFLSSLILFTSPLSRSSYYKMLNGSHYAHSLFSSLIFSISSSLIDNRHHCHPPPPHTHTHTHSHTYSLTRTLTHSHRVDLSHWVIPSGQQERDSWPLQLTGCKEKIRGAHFMRTLFCLLSSHFYHSKLLSLLFIFHHCFLLCCFRHTIIFIIVKRTCLCIYCDVDVMV